MKSLFHLSAAVVFILFYSSCNRLSKNSEKYTDYERGYRLWYYDNLDSAFLLFNKYVNNADDTFKKGASYKYMGEIQWRIGDLHGAEESLTNAIHTLDSGNEKHWEEIGYAYNIFGNVSLDLKHYDEAIGFYNKAAGFFKDTYHSLEIMNGKATALQKKKNYNEAISVYDSILDLNPADQSLFARVVDNKARAKWMQSRKYNPLPEFWLALKIRADSQYNIGLNASYAHLSDYYAEVKSDSAFWYANEMHKKAIENNNPDDVLEARDKLIRLSKAPVLKEYWYEEYRKLNDSVQLARNTTKSRFALIRYDFQKSKADNLALQQHITKQQIWMLLLIGLALIAMAGSYAWYTKRKKRIKEETEKAIQQSKLKTSQKVHDVVANGLYRIMNELEHKTTIEKELLINKIENLYEESRNISYEDVANQKHTADYDRHIHDLLIAFSNKQTQLIIVGNQPVFWNNISTTQKQELQLILNELMVNMKKHSHAKNVVVTFKKEGNKAVVQYKDDGVGFLPGTEFSNGLNNTVNRIKSLRGNINFEKNDKAGLLITMSFPL